MVKVVSTRAKSSSPNQDAFARVESLSDVGNEAIAENLYTSNTVASQFKRQKISGDDLKRLIRDGELYKKASENEPGVKFSLSDMVNIAMMLLPNDVTPKRGRGRPPKQSTKPTVSPSSRCILNCSFIVDEADNCIHVVTTSPFNA